MVVSALYILKFEEGIGLAILGIVILAPLSLFALSSTGFILELRHRGKSGQSILSALWSPSFPILLLMVPSSLLAFFAMWGG